VVEGDVHHARLSGDATKLSQAIRNLADNATRAARDKVRLTLTEQAGTAIIAFDDDGDGVPAAERSRVFERFIRLDTSRDRSSGGSGLGLSFVREIVRGHGGTVEITNSPLGGARFVVKLPVTGQPVSSRDD
jgi:signal transduction histidine kinase